MIVAAALLGIFLPSSVEGDISKPLVLAGFVLPALVLLCAIRGSAWQQARLVPLVLLGGIFLVATLISSLGQVAPGAVAPYLLASMVLLTDLGKPCAFGSPKTDLLLIGVVFFLDGLILAFGLGILLETPFAVAFIRDNYQALSDELFEQMVVWYSKPVTFFGSHSTAAFVYFSLFAINFKIASTHHLKMRWRLFYLASAVGFLVLNWALASNTSFVMTIMAAAILFLSLTRPMPKEWRLLLLIILALGALLAAGELVALLFDGEDGNGFFARYAPGGRLQGTYDYLMENAFIPIGFSHSPDIALGDNFIGEYIIKISPLGYGLILYLLWSWLRRSLDLRQAAWFFGFFLLADLAYPLLVYARAAAALPFYVLLWRRLDSADFAGPAARRYRGRRIEGGAPWGAMP